MARVLIVGCGARGQALAERLGKSGFATRGTTRDPARTAAIAACGAEAVLADPGRLATIAPALAGVSVLCWLMGTAEGDRESVEALHGPRLETLLGVLVDTPVRGVVYEASGSVDPAILAGGRMLVERARLSHRMPVAFIETSPGDHEAWLADATAGVDAVLA